MNDELTSDETTILETLIRGDPNEQIYRVQIAASQITREYTEVGFFVNFNDCETEERGPTSGRLTLNATGRLSGIDVGLILFIDHGRATMLECYTYGGERLPANWTLETVEDHPDGVEGGKDRD